MILLCVCLAGGTWRWSDISRAFFFFSSRRRHTRCALVTGVQTCALPISAQAIAAENPRVLRVLGGMSPIDPDFVRNMQWRGVLDCIDVVAEIGRASCRERGCRYV